MSARKRLAENHDHKIMRVHQALLLSATLLLEGGCAHYPDNARLEHYDPQAGYRFRNLSNTGNSDSLQIFLAFSGGGTRAAALSYGVLEELGRTQIVWEGQRRRLLDEVDYISAVSGGSFTAAYYALYGDRIFADYEGEFLNQNIQRQLIWRLCSPLYWGRLASPYFNRSDMAAEFYDRHLFGGKTYGDLLKRNRRPFLSLNATDMSLGASFQFTQEHFDYLCSDISTFPIARAVAASAAFPILLSPITVNNYGGSCGCVQPAWMASALTNRQERTRRTVKARELQSYQNSTQHPYVHLLDGGLTDNLGLRGPFEDIAAKGSLRNKVQDDLNPNLISKMVIIVVNAAFQKDRGWDHYRQPPSITQVTLALGSVPMNRYSFETLELLRANAKKWETEWNEVNHAAAGPQSATPPLKLYIIEVSFDSLEDDAEKDYFEKLPTSFKLPPGAVARLRAVAAKLLNQSETYRALLRDLASDSDQPERASK
jgi:NTE family protein